MSRQHFDEGSISKYTLTAFLSFVTVFCFLMLMMQCHGDFMPGHGGGHDAAAGSHGSEATVDTHGASSGDAVAAISKAESVKVMLPGGIELDALKGGIEDKLVAG